MLTGFTGPGFPALVPKGRWGRTLDDTWEFDVTTQVWVQRNPNMRPRDRFAHGLVFDAARGRVVLHGGEPRNDPNTGPLLQDVWEWDGANWTPATASGLKVRQVWREW